MSSQPLDILRFPLYGSRLIEASAGTGKTYTLALMYIRLVLDHGGEQAFGRPLTPPEILVVTFTEAATEELRDRIRQRLGEAARCFAEPALPHDPVLIELRDSYDQSHWSRCARLLRLAADWMDEAAVSTIHGWCYRMLREHAFESGTLFNLDMKADQSELLAEVVRDYWRRHFYRLSFDAAAALRRHFASPEHLEKALTPLLNRDDAEFCHGGAPVTVPDSLEELLERDGGSVLALEREARQCWACAVDELNGILHELRPHLNGTSFRKKQDDAVFAGWLEELARWSQGDPCEQVKKFGQRRLKLNKGMTAPEHPALAAIDAWLDHEERFQEIRTPILMHALRQVSLQLEIEKRRRAQIGFNDLLTRLDCALQGPAGERLASRIRRQYPMAMIDEFQDTDPLQYRIFDRIYSIAEPPAGCGLLLIGDPKQAIYAFRGADIHTYLRARQATEGRHYTLSRNYRSSEAMVAAVNRCFDFAETHSRAAFRFLDGSSDNPLPFLPVSAQGCDERLVLPGVSGALHFWCLDDEKGVVSVRRYREEMAERCASEIRRWLEEAACNVAGFVSETGFRALRPADIAILVRSRTEAEIMREALAKRRMASVYLSDRDSLFDTPEAQDVLHWLRACADPGDDILLRRALATGSLVLDWQTLERLNTDETHWERQVLRFRDYQRQWRKQGVLPMLRQLLHDFEVPARLLRQSGGERCLTNLLHLSEWLQQAAVELDGEYALVRHLAECLQRPDAEEILRLESDAALIKVVTIHKAKGLEYPLVLLPFISHWREIGGRHEAAYHDAVRGVFCIELVKDRRRVESAYQAANDERLSEDMRLLYVALTRARHGVWLGIAPLCAGQAKTPELHKGAIGYLLGGGQSLDGPMIASCLQQLQSDCAAIVIEPAPEANDQPLTVDTVEQSLTLRVPSRSVAENWWIASYSALAQSAGESRKETPEPISAEESIFFEERNEPVTAIAVPTVQRGGLWDFPRGPNPGTFLHGLLEWAGREGFEQTRLAEDKRREFIERRCALRGWENWTDALDDWLATLLRTSLRWPTGSVSLAALHTYQVEMEFWFASHKVSTAALDDWVTRHILPKMARPALETVVLNGMFKGFIDMVFEHQGRYYVVDYKSNWLDDYCQSNLQRAILEHRYDLQYALYLLAMHRQLKARLPDYDYDRHMGGALYLFVRGLEAETQGIYFDRPSRVLIESLDALFSGDDDG